MSVGAQVRESWTSIRGVFRNPGLARVNAALAGSVVGDWAYGVAVSVYAYLEGGATAVGVLGVVRYLLAAVVMPFSSTLADRYDRRRIMVASDLVRFALVVAAAAVIATDGPAIAVYALSVMASLAATAFRPAQAALVPRLARDPDELTAANVASSTIESLGFFAGPALAGVLLAVTDVEVVFVFNALTFVWSAALLRSMVVPPAEAPTPVAPAPDAALAAAATVDGAAGAGADPAPPLDSSAAADGDPEDRPESFLAESMAGFRTIGGHRDLRLLVGVYAGQTVVAGASLVFTVAIALDLLELDESAVGLLDATVGIGGLVGGFVALVLAQRGTLARDFGLGVVAWSAPLLLVAAVPELWAAIVAMVVIGLANSVVDVNAFTVMQRLVADEVMGRVFGAMESALIAAMALGSLAMPLLISTVGLRTGLLVIGLPVVIGAIAALPGLARIDRVALAPEGVDLLRAVPLLAPLPPPVLDRLARTSVVHRFGAGEVVFAEGEPGDRFYVIEEGAVEVSIRGEHVRHLAAGDSFGEIALLRDVPRTATVRAVGDVVCRSLTSDDFVPAVTGHGDARQEAEAVMTRWLAVV